MSCLTSKYQNTYFDIPLERSLQILYIPVLVKLYTKPTYTYETCMAHWIGATLSYCSLTLANVPRDRTTYIFYSFISFNFNFLFIYDTIRLFHLFYLISSGGCCA